MTDDSAPPPEEPKGVGLDSHRSDEAIYGAFNPGPLGLGMAEDGLPTIEPPAADTHAPPLHPKTMVCIADKSSFVMRDSRWGEVLATFEPGEVKRAPSGGYYVELDAMEGKLAPELLEMCKAEALEDARSLMRFPVEPIRPQCKHLRRQMTDFQDASNNQLVERLCTARRDSESFFLSLRDQQVHACELREPRHAESEVRLDRFDEAKMKLGAERYAEGGEFDVDAALDRTEAEADKGMSYGGIFKSSTK
jgi:hypothetical protein